MSNIFRILNLSFNSNAMESIFLYSIFLLKILHFKFKHFSYNYLHTKKPFPFLYIRVIPIISSNTLNLFTYSFLLLLLNLVYLHLLHIDLVKLFIIFSFFTFLKLNAKYLFGYLIRQMRGLNKL